MLDTSVVLRGSSVVVGLDIALRLKFCDLSTTCFWNLSPSSPSFGRSPDLLVVSASALVLALPGRYTILKLNLDKNSDQRA